MTDWIGFVEYRCGCCHERCINHHSSAAARYRRCQSCVSVPDLDSKPRDKIVPSLRWAANIVASLEPAVWSCLCGGRTEARMGESPAAQRSEQPGTQAEGRPRSAPESDSPPSVPIGDAADRLSYRRTDR